MDDLRNAGGEGRLIFNVFEGTFEPSEKFRGIYLSHPSPYGALVVGMIMIRVVIEKYMFMYCPCFSPYVSYLHALHKLSGIHIQCIFFTIEWSKSNQVNYWNN